MTLTLQYDREDDGRWIAGVHVYGETKDAARRGAIGLALRVLADEVERGERVL